MASGKNHDLSIYFATPVVGICIGYYLSPMLGLIAASSHLLGGLYLSFPRFGFKEPTLEALGTLEIYLATLPKLHPTSTLAKSCPCYWYNRAVALSKCVVVPSVDRPFLGTATAPTWQ